MRVNSGDSDILKSYLEKGFSIVPTEFNGRKPLLDRWKPYQYQQPSMYEVEQWFEKYIQFNISLVMNDFVGIDVDDMSRYSDLVSDVPEVEETASHTTPRGMRSLFTVEKPIKKQNKFLDIEGIELIGSNLLVLAPYSIVDVPYEFMNPLDCLMPFPKRLLEEVRALKTVPVPKFHTDRLCIRQAVEYPLKEGERNITLFYIFHGLQVGDKNNKAQAAKVVRAANKNLRKPLLDSEVEGIFKSNTKYRTGCRWAQDNLPFEPRCEDCLYLNKRLGMKKNPLQRFHSRIPLLNTSGRSVFLLSGTYFDGEIPTPHEIRKVSGTDYDVAKNGLKNLDKIIPELGIREEQPKLYDD